MVVAFVNLGVGITQLDGDISDQLVLETDSLYTRDSLDHGRLSVSDMTNRSDVDSCLSRDNLRSQGGELRYVKILRVGLWRERRPLDRGCRRGLLHGGLQGLVLDLLVRGVLRLEARGVGTRVGFRPGVAKLVAVGSHVWRFARGRLEVGYGISAPR